MTLIISYQNKLTGVHRLIGHVLTVHVGALSHEVQGLLRQDCI